MLATPNAWGNEAIYLPAGNSYKEPGVLVPIDHYEQMTVDILEKDLLKQRAEECYAGQAKLEKKFGFTELLLGFLAGSAAAYTVDRAFSK